MSWEHARTSKETTESACHRATQDTHAAVKSCAIRPRPNTPHRSPRPVDRSRTSCACVFKAGRWKLGDGCARTAVKGAPFGTTRRRVAECRRARAIDVQTASATGRRRRRVVHGARGVDDEWSERGVASVADAYGRHVFMLEGLRCRRAADVLDDGVWDNLSWFASFDSFVTRRKCSEGYDHGKR
jgi:hypothetical protein